MLCFKVYLAAMVIFGIVFYVMHVFVPYSSKYVPPDFVPPAKWIGSFSKGQFAGYMMVVFLCPIPFVLGTLLAVLDVSSDISATVSAILLFAILFFAVIVERKIDKW